MMDFDQLMRLGPGDKMTIAFTKNPKPSWLSQQQQQNAEGAAPAPAPAPAPPPPMVPPMPSATGGLPPSPMAMELMKRAGQ